MEYIIIIFLIISIIISFGIGANDETMAPLYGSRILNMKQILIVASVFAIAGAFLLGEGVAKSVGESLLLLDYANPDISQEAVVLTILISTAVVLILSSAFGLPISSTHATIGGIMGLGMFLGGTTGVNWESILQMSIWWIASPIVGFTVTYGVVKALDKHKLKFLKGFKVGDKIFVSKLTYGPKIPFTSLRIPGFSKPKSFDIIVFVPPIATERNKAYIKRLIGLPGDRIKIKGGNIYINGKIVDNSKVARELSKVAEVRDVQDLKSRFTLIDGNQVMFMLMENC